MSVPELLEWQRQQLFEISRSRQKIREITEQVMDSNRRAYAARQTSLQSLGEKFEAVLQDLHNKHRAEMQVIYDAYESLIEGNSALLRDQELEHDWMWVRFYKEFRDRAPDEYAYSVADFLADLSPEQQQLYAEHFGVQRAFKLGVTYTGPEQELDIIAEGQAALVRAREDAGSDEEPHQQAERPLHERLSGKRGSLRVRGGEGVRKAGVHGQDLGEGPEVP
jgi:phosphoglycolate phosphatase-like HAD superfamily hydrolase